MMTRSIKIMILILVIVSFFSMTGNLSASSLADLFGGGGGTISVLDQFVGTTSPSSAITQRTFGKALKITGLTTGLCLTLDANNLLTTVACGGSASLTYPLSSNYFVATSTATSTFSGGIESGTKIATPYFIATSTTATSTLPRVSSTGISATWLCLTGDTCRTTWPTGTLADWLQELNVFSVNSLTPTTTIPIAIKSTATSTFAGGLEAWSKIGSPYFIATSTTESSVFPNASTTQITASSNVFVGTKKSLITSSGGTTASLKMYPNGISTEEGFTVNRTDGNLVQIGIADGTGILYSTNDFAPSVTNSLNLGGASNVWKKIFTTYASTTQLTVSDSATSSFSGGIESPFIGAQYYVATSSKASQFPYASSTALTSTRIYLADIYDSSNQEAFNITSRTLTDQSGVTAIDFSNGGSMKFSQYVSNGILAAQSGDGSIGIASNGTDYTLITGTTCDGTDKVSAVAADGTVTCSADSGGTGGQGTVSTSTSPTIGNLAYWTSKDAWPETLGSVATTSLTASSPLSLSQPISVIGSSASALTIDVTGDWTGTIDGNNFAGGAVTTGDLLYGSAAGVISELGIGTGGYILGVSNDLPAWIATTTIPLGGDVTGTLSVSVVGNDSHAHTGSTLSGIDISADTNLTAGDGLTLTDDDLDCDTANGTTFGCLSAANWNTFNNKWDLASSSLSANTLTGFNGSTLISTGTPQLTVGNLLATSTAATSTLMGGLVVDTNSLVVDYSTNRVGIGMANPSKTLDVQGEASTTALYLPNTSTSTSPYSGIVYQGGNRFLHTYGTKNLFLGNLAGNITNISGTGYNVGIGDSALTALTTGYQNTAIGASALQQVSSGYDNFGMGAYALYSVTTQTGNVAIGSVAGQYIASNSNTAIGYEAMRYNTSGGSSIGIGSGALRGTNTGAGAVTGFYNTGLGYNALTTNTSGERNVGISYFALGSNTTGSNNTAIGMRAGYTDVSGNANTTGSYNTFIGSDSGPGTATQLSYSGAFGYLSKVTASNSIVLGGMDSAAASVGIGTTSPSAKLSVSGKNGATIPAFLVSTSTTGYATSTALVIDANGKVGIGTTTPSQQLSVAGNIYATGNLLIPIEKTFNYATTTSTTASTTLQFAGNVKATRYIQMGCSSIGGTAIVQLGDGTASSTSITSSTGNTTSFTTLTTNNLFTSGEVRYFDIGNWSGTNVTQVTCTLEQVNY